MHSEPSTDKKLLAAQIANLEAETELLKANARLSNAHAESVEVNTAYYSRERAMGTNSNSEVS